MPPGAPPRVTRTAPRGDPRPPCAQLEESFWTISWSSGFYGRLAELGYATPNDAVRFAREERAASDLSAIGVITDLRLTGCTRVTKLAVDWKLYDNLSWNWTLGRLMPGKAYDSATATADDVDAVQGVLSYKF